MATRECERELLDDIDRSAVASKSVASASPRRAAAVASSLPSTRRGDALSFRRGHSPLAAVGQQCDPNQTLLLGYVSSDCFASTAASKRARALSREIICLPAMSSGLAALSRVYSM